MSHAPKLNALEAKVAGRLSPQGRARIARHVEACATCRAALEAIVTYATLRDEARELAPPALTWETLERALDAEDHHARRENGVADGVHAAHTRREERKGGRVIALAFPLFAVAATLVIAWIGVRGQRKPAEGPAPRTPVVAHTPVFEAPALAGWVTLTSGLTERTRRGTKSPLVPGEEVHEHDILHVAEHAELHVVLANGSGFALFENTELRLKELRENGVELALTRGEVLSQVKPLAAAQRYVVHGTTYAAHVRGTRFVVQEREGFDVQVHEGRVEIMQGDRSIAMLEAGQHWSSRGAEQPPAHDPRVYGVGKVMEGWPVLRLPAHAKVAAWRFDDLRVSAGGELAMRAPVGELTLMAEDLKERLHPMRVEVVPEGTRLAEGVIDAALSPPRDQVGFLAPEQISPVVQAGLERLRRCYERILRNAPNFESKLVLSIRVAPDGHVSRAEIEAEALPAALEACVLTEARSWRFPRPQGGPVSFVVPLNLKARP